MKVVKAIYVGDDDWGRQTVATKEKHSVTLKAVDGVWHHVTSSGEPDTPISKNIRIEVIE